MCLPVFTEIPEALTFTPLSVSLRGGEGMEGVKRGQSTHDFFVPSMVLEIAFAT